MSITSNVKPIILTGDRTTGPLHIGHYVGSLKNRIALQHTYEQFLLLADTQALTDNAHDPHKVRRNVMEIATDYLAVGIDPNLTTICVQSALPALAELTVLYLNYVTVSRLERNPTIKEEIQSRNFGRDIPAGFLCYPASQAADITAFKATLVPVGEDQLPIIQQTNEISHRINTQIGREVLPQAKALVPELGRLPAPDGKGKMSKSKGNAIMLSATPEEIKEAVMSMYTDPNHLQVSDPGSLEGNVVFTYLDAFDNDKETLKDLKLHYQKGGLGDMVVKRRLEKILQDFLAPIREKRLELSKRPHDILDVIRVGTHKARQVTQNTKDEVHEALGLFVF